MSETGGQLQVLRSCTTKPKKFCPIDDYTLLAISGSFARAMEVVRYLRTSFKLFERTYLQQMSLDGKLAELAKVVRAGIPEALQGIGGFIPILTTFDRESKKDEFSSTTAWAHVSRAPSLVRQEAAQCRFVVYSIILSRPKSHSMT